MDRKWVLSGDKYKKGKQSFKPASIPKREKKYGRGGGSGILLVEGKKRGGELEKKLLCLVFPRNWGEGGEKNERRKGSKGSGEGTGKRNKTIH